MLLDKNQQDKELERVFCNTLSALTVLTRELSKGMEIKDKVKLFEEKREFLKNNGIDKLSAEDLKPHIYELGELLKDFIAITAPKHLKKIIIDQQRAWTQSIQQSKGKKKQKTLSDIKKELRKKNVSPRLKLMKSVHNICNIPVSDLVDKSEKEMKQMLADFMMK